MTTFRQMTPTNADAISLFDAAIIRRASLDAVLKRAAAQPLTDAIVSRFKARARGEWALENLSLEERSWELGNAVAQGLDADVAARVDEAIERVTPADLQRVAKRYFQRFDVALVLPREGSGG